VSPKEDDAFDRWLRRTLHELYNPVAVEPIPEELRRLIEDELRRKEG
jgi:hypothetical protein